MSGDADLIIGCCRPPRLERALAHLTAQPATLLARESITTPPGFPGERLAYRSERITRAAMATEFGDRLFGRRWNRVFIIYNDFARDGYGEVERFALALTVAEVWGVYPSQDRVPVTRGLRFLRDRWRWLGPILTAGLSVLALLILPGWFLAAWIASWLVGVRAAGLPAAPAPPAGDPVAEQARMRWRTARPAPDLTWDREPGGGAFIAKVAAAGGFGAERAILEIGPGYGRLLAAALAERVPFRAWTGLDLSRRNVARLTERFAGPRVTFLHGDVEALALPGPVETVISSLTFKHLYPTFAVAAKRIAGALVPGGLLVFDLIEGTRQYFEAENGTTYIRWYERSEVTALLRDAGFSTVDFDEVEHDSEHRRLLVIARR